MVLTTLSVVRESLEDERSGYGYGDIVCRRKNQNQEKYIMSRCWRAGAYASLRQVGYASHLERKWREATYRENRISETRVSYFDDEPFVIAYISYGIVLASF